MKKKPSMRAVDVRARLEAFISAAHASIVANPQTKLGELTRVCGVSFRYPNMMQELGIVEATDDGWKWATDKDDKLVANIIERHRSGWIMSKAPAPEPVASNHDAVAELRTDFEAFVETVSLDHDSMFKRLRTLEELTNKMLFEVERLVARRNASSEVGSWSDSQSKHHEPVKVDDVVPPQTELQKPEVVSQPVLVIGPHDRDWRHIDEACPKGLRIVRFDKQRNNPIPANCAACIVTTEATQFIAPARKLYNGNLRIVSGRLSGVKTALQQIAAG